MRVQINFFLDKGQIISKRLFGILGFFQKTNEPHCEKVQKYEQSKIRLQFFDIWC